MSSPGFEMSLEPPIPAVMMKKTGMNGEGGPPCGLTSLLPMSCRGRAAAFARDLHSRLRSLGAQDGGWPDAAAPPPSRDHDTFYDFELECESPSSPVDELDAPFAPAEEPPFYDFDQEEKLKNLAKLKLQQPPPARSNGFTFSTAFFTDSSPVQLQPAGRADKLLYSPITFDGCARHDGHDQPPSPAPPALPEPLAPRLQPLTLTTNGDSDSEFESAKSDPSEAGDDTFEYEHKKDTELPEVLDALSICETEMPIEEVVPQTIETNEIIIETSKTEEILPLELITESSPEKELSPELEIDTTLLRTETKDDEKQVEDNEDDKPQRVRRCSSLKTGKTPPGTPGRKKIVRFADVLGLDLADVKTFMDEIPVIPKSAYDDLSGCDVANSPPVRAPPRLGALTLVPLFQVPRDITEKLTRLSVCLESARVGEGIHMNICGSVRVRNLDFHKTVHVRYSMNRWKTHTDLQATYVPGSCDGFSDRFHFVLYAPCLASGQRLEVAVRFQCKGQQFWDNNSGANYCFDCLALGALTSTTAAAPLHPTVDWHPSFY
ncbi:hypothetical protein JYU34_021113 [Plutella xylostella]|uniref:CBM21 domain-containing protein n=1 Tax=Plutella xylostella TaxID=51655 RepID=A0ABQ7PSQ9_PLUXY|nr:hypothetical protein JYU34_021113 [Plutella xylostella]